MTQPHDIENPDWSPFTTDGAMTFDQDRHGHAGILTIHGMLDLVNHLGHTAKEEIEEWIERGEREEEMPEWLRAVLPTDQPPPVPVFSFPVPARAFRMDEIQIPALGGQSGGATKISDRQDRIRLIVANVDTANTGFIGASSDTSGLTAATQSGGPNWAFFPRAASSPFGVLEIRARGPVYAYSFSGMVISVQEEYGFLTHKDVFGP